jgi:ATP synthase protein I
MVKTPEDIIREAEALRRKLNEPVERKVATGYSEAVRIIVEMIAPLMVSLPIGYYIDDWLGTKPIFLLVFLCLGIATAMTIIKRINDSAYKTGVDSNAGNGAEDDTKKE